MDSNNIKCGRCCGKGIIATEGRIFVCDCKAGDSALFDEEGVQGQVSGAEMRRYFVGTATEFLEASNLDAKDLPGRNENLNELKELAEKLLLFEAGLCINPDVVNYYTIVSDIQSLTTKMLGLKS